MVSERLGTLSIFIEHLLTHLASSDHIVVSNIELKVREHHLKGGLTPFKIIGADTN